MAIFFNILHGKKVMGVWQNFSAISHLFQRLMPFAVNISTI
jgi:hypothetical protein